MDDPVRPGEDTALRNITSTFGESIWKNVLIALTFANKVEPADPGKDEATYFKEILESKREDFRRHFGNLPIKKQTVDDIVKRIYPTGSAKALVLPGMKKDWRIDFWLGCLDTCPPEGKAALFKLTWSPQFMLKVVGASVGTTGGTVCMVAGVGGVVGGIVLTATGILAPVGVPLIAAGAVATLLGVGATAGGTTGIKAAKQEHEQLHSLEN